MCGKQQKPSWWIFYLLWSLMIGLWGWDYWTPMSDGQHAALALAIMAVCYALVARWLYLNREALRREDEIKHVRRTQRRDGPLSSTQAHYLTVVERYKPK
jgi:hypothetical protein